MPTAPAATPPALLAHYITPAALPAHHCTLLLSPAQAAVPAATPPPPDATFPCPVQPVAPAPPQPALRSTPARQKLTPAPSKPVLHSSLAGKQVAPSGSHPVPSEGGVLQGHTAPVHASPLEAGLNLPAAPSQAAGPQQESRPLDLPTGSAPPDTGPDSALGLDAAAKADSGNSLGLGTAARAGPGCGLGIGAAARAGSGSVPGFEGTPAVAASTLPATGSTGQGGAGIGSNLSSSRSGWDAGARGGSGSAAASHQPPQTAPSSSGLVSLPASSQPSQTAPPSTTPGGNAGSGQVNMIGNLRSFLPMRQPSEAPHAGNGRAPMQGALRGPQVSSHGQKRFNNV